MKLTFVLFFVFPIDILLAERDQVLIYGGPGASETCIAQTKATLQKALKSNYNVQVVLPAQIINGNWEANTALLVIPGGADVPYKLALNGIGDQKIRAYVENGGAYLGICAGGYYAGNFVEFAKGTPLEVSEKRDLAFFPGVVKGPVLSEYFYNSEKGAKAATINWKDNQGFQKGSTFTVYFNGGGYFVDASKKPVTVLATYSLGEDYPAVIECRVGKGKAILTGVHLEFDPNLLDSNDQYLKPIIPAFKAGNAQRVLLVQHLLQRLNLTVKNAPASLSPP